MEPSISTDLCQGQSSPHEAQGSLITSDPGLLSATATLATLLQQDANGRQREIWASLGWAGALAGSVFFLLSNAQRGKDALVLPLAVCYLFLGAAVATLCLHLVQRSTQRKRAQKEVLAHLYDKQQIGLLIRSLRVQNTLVRNLAKHHLIHLLPLLSDSDGALLGNQERKILLHSLAILPNHPGYRDIRELFSRSAARREMDLRLAILKALEQVGGMHELGVVQRLTRGLPPLQSTLPVPWEIRKAAGICLPYLQARSAQQGAGAHLLRAASPASPDGDVLLRPASLGSITPSEHLVRAIEPLL